MFCSLRVHFKVIEVIVDFCMFVWFWLVVMFFVVVLLCFGGGKHLGNFPERSFQILCNESCRFFANMWPNMTTGTESRSSGLLFVICETISRLPTVNS